MGNSFPRIWIGLVLAIVVSFASIGLSTYSVTKSLQFTPTMTYTTISLGQKFNWNLAEVIEVQGNLFAYLGYEYSFVHLAKWQNGWLELSYYFGYLPQNATLFPYILAVYGFSNDYLIAQFFES